METTRYLIVGGGMAGDAACRGILDVDPDPGAILIVSGEYHPPYARPPLSKALWRGAAESTSAVLKAAGAVGTWRRRPRAPDDDVSRRSSR